MGLILLSSVAFVLETVESIAHAAGDGFFWIEVIQLAEAVSLPRVCVWQCTMSVSLIVATSPPFSLVAFSYSQSSLLHASLSALTCASFGSVSTLCFVYSSHEACVLTPLCLSCAALLCSALLCVQPSLPGSTF